MSDGLTDVFRRVVSCKGSGYTLFLAVGSGEEAAELARSLSERLGVPCRCSGCGGGWGEGGQLQG